MGVMVTHFLTFLQLFLGLRVSCVASYSSAEELRILYSSTLALGSACVFFIHDTLLCCLYYCSNKMDKSQCESLCLLDATLWNALSRVRAIDLEAVMLYTRAYYSMYTPVHFFSQYTTCVHHTVISNSWQVCVDVREESYAATVTTSSLCDHHS